MKMDTASHVGHAPFKQIAFDHDEWDTVYLNFKQDIANIFDDMS